MKSKTLWMLTAVLATTACAQTATGPGSANRAQVECQGMARAEGLGDVTVVRTEAAGTDYRVTLQGADRVGRRIVANCLHSAQGARWAEPLPAGLVLR
jgi:DNA-binding NtrC family response regulator